MRIGFFSDSYFPEVDGVTYTLKLWKQKLEDRGHDVYIIYPQSEGYEAEENEIPVKSVGNPFYGGYNVPIPTSFDGFPQDLDIVHCHTPLFLGVAGRLYAREIGARTVYTHHTPLEEYFDQNVRFESVSNSLARIYVPTEEWLLSKFDVVTSNTDGGRRSIEMQELAAGVDMEFFQPTESDWDLEGPVIGYSGRISGEKNVDQILKVAKRFDATFVIVGEGPEKEKLEENAPENVVFKDFLDREDLPGYYSMLDIYVTASTGDTLGLSPLEANACGTPVVAPDVHPFNSTIGEQSGERFEYGELDDMEEKIRVCLRKNYTTRESVKQYSMSKTIDQLEEVYEGLNDDR
jgi:1,2-diacylglycerol 3-alpha-glucosyltransferase